MALKKYGPLSLHGGQQARTITHTRPTIMKVLDTRAGEGAKAKLKRHRQIRSGASLSRRAATLGALTLQLGFGGRTISRQVGLTSASRLRKEVCMGARNMHTYIDEIVGLEPTDRSMYTYAHRQDSRSRAD